uniref:Uncharacterized protein n=1 Tax=Cucumis sativus TaxID=3659 RepID=A0A0A0LJ79_CUCSA
MEEEDDCKAFWLLLLLLYSVLCFGIWVGVQHHSLPLFCCFAENREMTYYEITEKEKKKRKKNRFGICFEELKPNFRIVSLKGGDSVVLSVYMLPLLQLSLQVSQFQPNEHAFFFLSSIIPYDLR